MSCLSQLREWPRHLEAGFLKSSSNFHGCSCSADLENEGGNLHRLKECSFTFGQTVRKLQRINNSVWNPSIDLTPLSIGQDILTLAVAVLLSPLYLWVWGQAKTVPSVTFCYCTFIRSHGFTRKHKASNICTAWVWLPPEWDSCFDVISMCFGLTTCGKSGIVFQELEHVFHGTCTTTNDGY